MSKWKTALQDGSLVGCGDHSCLIAKPASGVGTNGGCRCFSGLKTKERLNIQKKLHIQRMYIEELEEQIEAEKELYLG